MSRNKKLENALLQTGVSLIPGVGQYLAPLVGALNQPDTPVAKKAAEQKLSTNPYGKVDTLITPDQVPTAQPNPFVSNPMAEPNLPLAEPNMFVDNTQKPMQIDPLPTFDNITFQDGGNNQLATDSTQIVPNQELTLGKNLMDVPANISFDGKQAVNTNVDRGLDSNTANGIALGLKGIALGGSIVDALKPAVNEKLILPNYGKSDADLRAANIDFTQQRQDAVGISNIGASANRSMSNNASTYMGREQSRLAQLQDAIGRIGESENLAKSNLYLQKGQIENNRALDTANRKFQNDQNNQQNDAMGRYADRILSSDLASIGTAFNNYGSTQQINENNKSLNKFQTSQQIQILNTKYPNFKIDSKVMELIESGASIDDIVKMKQ